MRVKYSWIFVGLFSRLVAATGQTYEEELFSWEYNEFYASESPWPGDDVPGEFQQAPYIVYPIGIADKETSEAESSSESSSVYVSEDPSELGGLDGLAHSTETITVVSSVPFTVHAPPPTTIGLSTMYSTEHTTEYFTEYSGLSMQPITTTVTVTMPVEASGTANIVTFTPGPTSLAQLTNTMVMTELVTSTETAQPETDTNIKSLTITTTLPPTTTLTTSTTTVMQTVMATAQQTATATTQSGPTTITDSADITTTVTSITTVSTTHVVSGATGDIEPTVYVTTQQYVTSTHTEYLPPVVQPEPAPQPEQQPPPAPEQPPPEEPQPTTSQEPFTDPCLKANFFRLNNQC
ncbi:hypothetical protein IW148_005537 [Coemansia sp. RSA 1199]|nr:hypothetical protein IW148_005537 [Coemansia sp. RSA 1199]